jgi:hypothetical protein
MTLRFGFGENWLKFAADLRPEQIVEAEKSIDAIAPAQQDGLAHRTVMFS